MNPTYVNSVCANSKSLSRSSVSWGRSAVDSTIAAPDAGLNLQVTPELGAKLTRLAAETGRTVHQVTLYLLAVRR